MAQEEYYEDEYDEEVDVDEEIFDKPNWLIEMPYWAVSAILHIIVHDFSFNIMDCEPPQSIRLIDHNSCATCGQCCW